MNKIVKIIDGKEIAQKIENVVRKELLSFDKKPKIKIFLVGNDPASQVYVQKKQEFCQRVGIEVDVEKVAKEISQEDFLKRIYQANLDIEINAILIQLPLPKKLKEKEILLALDPKKDVDCLHPENFGIFCQYGKKGARVLPATALAVMKIFEEFAFDLEGKDIVMIGNSNIVGKPLSMMLSAENATVTLCQKKTQDLISYTSRADILITATGVRSLIKKDMIKEGAIIIDIGITREEGQIFGDVDFEKVSQKASWITPVPGGVGPITVAVLAENVLKLTKSLNN